MTDDEYNQHISHPDHYTQGGIECIDAMMSAFGRQAVQDFCLCNAFKYLWRHQHKGKALEDIGKAQWYLTRWQNIEIDKQLHPDKPEKGGNQ